MKWRLDNVKRVVEVERTPQKPGSSLIITGWISIDILSAHVFDDENSVVQVFLNLPWLRVFEGSSKQKRK
jgi:hypothetical protein